MENNSTDNHVCGPLSGKELVLGEFVVSACHLVLNLSQSMFGDEETSVNNPPIITLNLFRKKIYVHVS